MISLIFLIVVDLFGKEFFDTILGFSEFRLEVHTDAEDGAGEGQALCHIPEHPVRDIAFREKGDEGEDNTRHHHKGGSAVLDPFFAVCSHMGNYLIFATANLF